MSRPDEARRIAAKQDIGTIMQALKLYRLDNGRYPSQEQGLTALTQKPTTDPIPNNWKDGGYLERLPNDPWGNAYKYLNPRARRDRRVQHGADGKPGGEGNDTDVGSAVSVAAPRAQDAWRVGGSFDRESRLSSPLFPRHSRPCSSLPAAAARRFVRRPHAVAHVAARGARLHAARDARRAGDRGLADLARVAVAHAQSAHRFNEEAQRIALLFESAGDEAQVRAAHRVAAAAHGFRFDAARGRLAHAARRSARPAPAGTAA
jgi:general secretion pathway protein G